MFCCHSQREGPGLPIRDCAGSCINSVPRCTKVSAIHLTAKNILWAFVFGSRTGQIGPWQLSVCSHTTTVESTTFPRFSCTIFPRLVPHFFGRHDSGTKPVILKYARCTTYCSTSQQRERLRSRNNDCTKNKPSSHSTYSLTAPSCHCHSFSCSSSAPWNNYHHFFHGFGTNCMVPSDWDSAPKSVCGPNFSSHLRISNYPNWKFLPNCWP